MSNTDPKGGLMKLAVVGGGAVGKTALTVQFTMNHFVEYYDPTVEDIYRRPTAVDGETVMLELLDTAGQEEYSALRSSYYREGEGFIIVYAVNSRSSFEEVLQFRDEILKVKDVDSFPMVIVANKCDLKDQRCVSTTEGESLSKTFGQWCSYLETSAKDRVNVDEAFENLVRIVRNERLSRMKTIDEGMKKRKKKRRVACKIL